MHSTGRFKPSRSHGVYVQVFKKDSNLPDGYDPSVPLLQSTTTANEQTITNKHGTYTAYFQQVTRGDALYHDDNFTFIDNLHDSPAFSFLLSDDGKTALPRKLLRGPAKQFWGKFVVVVLEEEEEVEEEDGGGEENNEEGEEGEYCASESFEY